MILMHWWLDITCVMFAALNHANMILTHWWLDITCAMFATLNHSNMILTHWWLDITRVMFAALNHPNGEVIDLRWWISSVLVALLRSTNGVHTHWISADNLLHFTRWNGLFCLMFWCSLFDELIGNAEWWGRGLSWFWFFLNKRLCLFIRYMQISCNKNCSILR